MCAEVWGLFVDYSRSTVGNIYAIWQAYSLEACAHNVECTHASGCGHILDCIEFTSGKYADTVVSCLHMK